MARRHLNLILDLTSRCNLRCVMCYFSNTDQLPFKPYDLAPGSMGNIEMTVYRHVASELFPRAHTVALGCSAEPLLHPEFSEVLRVSREHRVPNVWIQTNLLALSETKARAIVEHGVRTVAASIDGTTKETYEHIRTGGSWDRLLSRLELLRQVGTSSSKDRPRLRITFVWMRSNREELKLLPEFASSVGARELDVRFVAPTAGGMDNREELLDDADANELMAELWSVARDATARGLRLVAYPAMKKEPDADDSLFGKARRKMWLLKSGIDGPEVWRHTMLERFAGCRFPGRMLLIRPNGAVQPCPFWEEEPIGLVPRDNFRQIFESDGLSEIRKGLRTGCPIGSCQTCEARKDALFRPFFEPRDSTAEPNR